MAEATHVRYRADDISCDHCKRAIEQAVGAVDGVGDVVVDVASKTVDVKLARADAEAAVRAAIEDAGYRISAELERD